MSIPARPLCWILIALLPFAFAATVGAADIGQIKIAKGQVSIERNGQSLPGDIGARLQLSDVVRTGADGSVGITMSDDTLLSADPIASFRWIGTPSIQRPTRGNSRRRCKRDRSR
jgi:hypothetical protein